MAGVGGGPSAVCTSDQVGDDNVGVKLWVTRPAGAVPEGGAEEPVGLDQLVSAGPPSGEAGLGGEVIEDGTNRPVMGNGDRLTDLVRSECPEQRDSLRGGECQVVAGTSILGEPGPQVVPGGGLAGKQISELIRADLTVEPESFRVDSNPPSRCFAPPEVVVVDVVGNLVEVILRAPRGAEPPYRQHLDASKRMLGDRFMVVSSGTTSP